MTGTRILILEHDPDLALVLTHTLRGAGYDADVVGDGRRGLRAALADPPALALIDLLLPGLNGLEICRRLRSNNATAELPILLLAARADDEAKDAAAAAGADGCVARPHAARTLVRRVQSLLLREGADAPETILRHGDIQLDRLRHQVFVGDREARLTLTEFRLLERLLLEPGRAFTRRQLVEAAVLHSGSSERVIDAFVKTLRRKLGQAGLVETVRGVGYRLRQNP